MNEAAPSSEESPTERQIKSWKKGPVVLASSSEFRRSQLEDMGFIDVSFAKTIPETVETDLAEKIFTQGGAPRSFDDTDGRNHSEHIAAAKVRHLLDKASIQPEDLVIGLDTTAVIYDDRTDENLMGVPRSAEKYETIEAAREGMIERLSMLAAGIKDRDERMEGFKKTAAQMGKENDEYIEEMLQAGIRRGYVYVNTGVAVAFPTEHDSIRRSTESVRLISEAVVKSGTDEQALEHLVDQIIAAQGEDKTLSISGGIDYADSYVRDILELRESEFFKQKEAPEDLYRGFSVQAINMILQTKAHELQSP